MANNYFELRNIPEELLNTLNKPTPIEKHGKIWVKRDDKFKLGGVCGGKARACYYLAYGSPGLVTAGSRFSPQVKIVSHVAKYFHIPCRCHVPCGEYTKEMIDAQEMGAKLIQHHPGHNSVIISRAIKDARRYHLTLIPFGMHCHEAIDLTSKQVENLPETVKRIIIPVGSAVNLSGLLCGLKKHKLNIPVVGIVVGAKPEERLDRYAPKGWKDMVKLVYSDFSYHTQSIVTNYHGLELDPYYEAKCIPFIEEGDLLWVVGHRNG